MQGQGQGPSLQGPGQGLDTQGPGQGLKSGHMPTRTRTSLTVPYCKLQLNLQSPSSNNNEHKVKIHNI